MSERVYRPTQFEVSEELGRGAFGVVYKGFDKVRRIDVAVKQIDLESNNEIDEIQQEIKMLSTCHSEQVTKYYGCFLKGYKLWIIMEYMGGGSCADLLTAGPFGEQAIGQILGQLLQALDYLHSNGKIHRDIKAANLLVGSTGKVKIADFGVATQLSNNMSRRNTFVGTPYWMAPEIIKHRAYTVSADIWSLGITAIELAYGKPPLSQYHPFDVLSKITDGPAPTLGGSFSWEFQDFVSKCLQKDPQNRPTAQELLKHKFIRRNLGGDRARLTELIDKKVRWDLETGNVDRKYYSPTNDDRGGYADGASGSGAGVRSAGNGCNVSSSSSSSMFDLGTITVEEKENVTPLQDGGLFPPVKQQGANSQLNELVHQQRYRQQQQQQQQQQQPSSSETETLKIVPQSPVKKAVVDDDWKLRKDMNSILNQSFNKIEQKYNMSTYEYDNLVKFQTTLMNSLFLDKDHEYREVFGKFFKLVLKRVMRSDNQKLKEKVLPKYYTNLEHEWLSLLMKEKEQEGSNGDRDEVEELLLTRWAENMLDR